MDNSFLAFVAALWIIFCCFVPALIGLLVDRHEAKSEARKIKTVRRFRFVLWAWVLLWAGFNFWDYIDRTLPYTGLLRPSDCSGPCDAVASAVASQVFRGLAVSHSVALVIGILPAVAFLRHWKTRFGLVQLYGWAFVVALAADWGSSNGETWLFGWTGWWMTLPLFVGLALMLMALLAFPGAYRGLKAVMDYRTEMQGGGPDLAARAGAERPPRPARNATANELPD